MGVYVVRMDQQQRERLPSVFADIGYPDPTLTHKEGVVRYSFRFGFLRRLSVDVFEVERPNGMTYDLWIPPTRSGGELFEALRERGYSRVPGDKNETAQFRFVCQKCGEHITLSLRQLQAGKTLACKNCGPGARFGKPRQGLKGSKRSR